MKQKYYKGYIYKIDPITKSEKDVPTVDASLVENNIEIVHFNKNFDYQHLPENFYFNFLALDNTVYRKKRKEKYVLNDIMPWEGDQPNGGESFVCSLKFEQIAKDYNLGDSRFYKAKLRNKDEFVDYRVCHFLSNISNILMWKYTNDDPTNKFKSYVKFPECVFTEYDGRTLIGLNEYICKDFQDFKLKSINSENVNGYPLALKKIVLTPEGSNLDIVPFREFQWLISERFHDALVANGITGIYMEEITDVEIYTS